MLTCAPSRPALGTISFANTVSSCTTYVFLLYDMYVHVTVSSLNVRYNVHVLVYHLNLTWQDGYDHYHFLLLV
jgi:hypothetical protein